MGKLISACITMALALVGIDSASALDVGARLPALSEVAWLGDAADPSGRFAIIDLWSPDNPACRAIMPRLTDLQRRHPEVRVIGLTAADRAVAEEFVKAMGSRVGYAIGVAPSLAPFSPPVGLPIALLLDRSGSVLWWGDAMDVAEPLSQALSGTFVPAPPMPLAPPVIAAPPEAAPPEAAPAPAPPAPVPQPQSRVERRTSVVIVGSPWVWCPDAWCAPRPRIWIPRPPLVPLFPPPPSFFFGRHHR